MYGGGAKYALKVKLWASWFCMDGGDEQAFLRSLGISANLNQEVRDVEEDVVLFQNQFLTCTVILTGDGIPTEYRHGPYKRRLKNCFKGWSLVSPSVSLCHMHHCMSMNALEQGLLGLEAAKASDIDDFV